jgi:hypothetical protein
MSDSNRWYLPAKRSSQPPHLGFAAFGHPFLPNQMAQANHSSGEGNNKQFPPLSLKKYRFKSLWRWYQTFDSYAWGIAIGIAAGVALWTAMELARRMQRAGAFIGTIIAFVGAFVAYEVLLYTTCFLLPGSEGAFAWPIVRWVLLINLLALTGLLVLHRVGSTLGLIAQRPISVTTAATS